MRYIFIVLFVLVITVQHHCQAADNTIHFAIYDKRFEATYIGWISSDPQLYQNDPILNYNLSYVSYSHHWSSLDADYHSGNVTFHDMENHWIYLSDDFETGTHARVLVGGTSGNVDGMTVDWLANNVYWVDAGYNWIKMTDYFGSKEVVIVDTGLERPSGIACHPLKAYLFWTELGTINPARIERSSMSGSNRVNIVTTDLNEPRAITVDTTTNRIYWTDNSATESKVESCDFDGNQRRTEVTQPSSSGTFNSIAIDENYIFISVHTALDDIVHYYNKTYSSDLVYEYNFGYAVQILDLCVAGPIIQPQPTILPCDGSECGHYCVSAENGNYECICDDNYLLLKNGTCIYDHSKMHPPFSVIGTPNAISAFNPLLLHYDVDYKHAYVGDIVSGVSNLIIATAVTIDIYSNSMFYANDASKQIFYVRLTAGSPAVVIHNYGLGGKVEGITVDWISLTVYFVDYSQNQLKSLSFDGMNHKVIFYDVMKPTDISVDPNAGFLFWTEEFEPKLVRSNLDGANRQTLLNTRLQKPQGIAIDYFEQKIYIVGEDDESIYFTDYDGSMQRVIGVSKHPAKDIAIYQDFLLLAEQTEDGLIESINKFTGVHEGSIVLNRTVYSIAFADKSIQPIPTVPSNPTFLPKTSPNTPTLKTTVLPGDESTTVIIGIVVAIGVIIAFLVLIVIKLICRNRNKRHGATDEPFAQQENEHQYVGLGSDRPQNPPTYESSISNNEQNQATGGLAVAYSKSELKSIPNDYNNAVYIESLDFPPVYTQNVEDSDYVDLNIKS